MTPLSKEEIREKHLFENGLSVNKGPVGVKIQKAAYGAMDEWAKIQSISFQVWLADNYDYNEFDKAWGKFWEVDEGVNQGFTAISTDDLYKLFIKDQ